jgi:YidC/Oxa1 family membrane protein insertase
LNPIAQLFFPIILYLSKTTGSFALAIVILTIVTRVLLQPLISKQIKAMQSQREKISGIQEKVKSLQEKYKDDPQELNRQTYELYQKAGINPFGGCSYYLIQMPFIYGLFGVINGFHERVPEEIRNQINFHLFGIDLTQVEPTIMPIISALSILLQSFIMPTQGGVDKKSMTGMNFIIALSFYFFSKRMPAGLVFYWIVSTLVHSVQNIIAYKQAGLQLGGGSVKK